MKSMARSVIWLAVMLGLKSPYPACAAKQWQVVDCPTMQALHQLQQTVPDPTALAAGLQHTCRYCSCASGSSTHQLL